MAAKRAYHQNPAPHRKLYRTARGEDVEQFQRGLNARLEHDPQKHARVSLDGYFGQETFEAWKIVRHLIGLPSWLAPTVRAQLNVRRPQTRSKTAMRRAKKRRAALAGTPGEKAADYLLGYVGRTESPSGSNDSPFLAAWRKALPTLGWMRGQPWCGFACRAAWHFGAGRELPDGVVYTPNIVNWANSGSGFTRVDPYKARKGDLVVFDFDGGGADHVGLALGPAKGGLIPTVEGNTSAGNSGSQSNGGGVYRRSRPLGIVAVVARPK